MAHSCVRRTPIGWRADVAFSSIIMSYWLNSLSLLQVVLECSSVKIAVWIARWSSLQSSSIYQKWYDKHNITNSNNVASAIKRKCAFMVWMCRFISVCIRNQANAHRVLYVCSKPVCLRTSERIILVKVWSNLLCAFKHSKVAQECALLIQYEHNQYTGTSYSLKWQPNQPAWMCSALFGAWMNEWMGR